MIDHRKKVCIRLPMRAYMNSENKSINAINRLGKYHILTYNMIKLLRSSSISIHDLNEVIKLFHSVKYKNIHTYIHTCIFT